MHTWVNQHDESCPVTRWREQLLADLERDPEDPYLLGAVPEYDEGGDQEAELCDCGPRLDGVLVNFDFPDPHCPAQRYRLYRRRGDELVCVSACADEAHVIGMIRDQRDPEAGATLVPDDAVGLLDSHGFRASNPLDEHGNYTLPGSWLIKPWVPAR